MYTSKHFLETNTTNIKALMAEFPLATIVAHNGDGFFSSHIPLFWQENAFDNMDNPSNTDLKAGELIGHMPKMNPLYRTWQKSDGCAKWLIIFQDTGCYISPNWYPDKAKTIKPCQLGIIEVCI